MQIYAFNIYNRLFSMLIIYNMIYIYCIKIYT
nr:MAG TPA: hypothetical protein [Caudoviricetes sp.]